jgi:hypothetical protein
MKVFDSRVLKRIFGTTRDVGVLDWGALHYEELHNLYSCQI